MALSEISGYSEHESVFGKVEHLTDTAKASVQQRVRQFGAPPSEISGGADPKRAALVELYGSHADYAGEARVVVPLRLDALSLPPAGT